MINIRAKLVIAFLVTILCMAAILFISLGGYNLIVSGIITSADRNNERVNGIHDIRELLNGEQQMLAYCIINSDVSKEADFKKSNGLIGQAVDRLSAGSAREDADELAKLRGLNGQYANSYVSVSDAVRQADKSGLKALLPSCKTGQEALLDREQRLKDTAAGAADAGIAKALSALEASGGRISGQAAGLEALRLEVQAAGKHVGEMAGLATDAGPGSIPDNYDALAVDTGSGLAAVEASLAKAASEMSETGALLENAGVDRISGDINDLNSAGRLIYWTQVKYAAVLEALSHPGDRPAAYDEASAGAAEILRRFEASPSKQYRDLSKSIAEDAAALDGELAKLLEAAKTVENAEISKAYADAETLYGRQQESLLRLEDSFGRYLAGDIEKSNRLKATLLRILAGMALLSLIIGMLIALLVSRSILNPIRKLTAVLGRAENGDLTGRISDRRRDELGMLADKVNNVLDGQQRMVEQVKSTSGDIGLLRKGLVELFAHSRENAGKVSNGFRNVINGIKSGVGRPEENLREIGAIAAGAENLSETADRVVRDGMRAVETAIAGEKSVEEAEEVIRRVTDTVREIADSINRLEDSSNRIGAITNTITEIASKTNLLALNAAIEAARAGQQGKGFTVLADEIRKLSEGSNKAAGEIKQLIAEIQKRIQFAVDRIGDGVGSVDTGVSKINAAKANILEITESVKYVIESLNATALAVKTQKTTAAGLVSAFDALAKAAGQTVATGEDVGRELEKQQDAIRRMEELSRKLDEVSGNIDRALGHFRV